MPSAQDIPFSEEKENDPEDDERDCQLYLGPNINEAKGAAASDLRMNQLFEWEHHSPPFGGDALQVILVSYLIYTGFSLFS